MGDGLSVELDHNTLVITSEVVGPMPSSGKIVLGISTHSNYILGTFPKGAHVNCGVMAFNGKGFGSASGYIDVVAP